MFYGYWLGGLGHLLAWDPYLGLPKACLRDCGERPPGQYSCSRPAFFECVYEVTRSAIGEDIAEPHTEITQRIEPAPDLAGQFVKVRISSLDGADTTIFEARTSLDRDARAAVDLSPALPNLHSMGLLTAGLEQGSEKAAFRATIAESAGAPAINDDQTIVAQAVAAASWLRAPGTASEDRSVTRPADGLVITDPVRPVPLGDGRAVVALPGGRLGTYSRPPDPASEAAPVDDSACTVTSEKRGKAATGKVRSPDAEQAAVERARSLGDRFAPVGNGTVIDRVTNLMWATYSNDEAVSWPEANRYARGLSLGGYRDWRLPTRAELYDTWGRMVGAEFRYTPDPYRYNLTRELSGGHPAGFGPGALGTGGSWTCQVRGSSAYAISWFSGWNGWADMSTPGPSALAVRTISTTDTEAETKPRAKGRAPARDDDREHLEEVLREIEHLNDQSRRLAETYASRANYYNYTALPACERDMQSDLPSPNPGPCQRAQWVLTELNQIQQQMADTQRRLSELNREALRLQAGVRSGSH